MPSPSPSLIARCLARLAQSVYRHKGRWIYPQVLLFGVSVFYTVGNLEFDMDRNDLVGADKKYHQNFLRFKEEFTGEDDLVAVVESEEREKNRQFVERLGAKMAKEPAFFADVIFKGDLKMMGPKALLFLPEETLAQLQETLRTQRPFIENFAGATNLNSLFRLVNEQFRTARREPSAENESLVEAIPVLTRLVEQAIDSLKRSGLPPAPGIAALFNAGPEGESQQYLTFANGQIYVVSARAANADTWGESVERLRELVRETQNEVPGMNVGITGEPVLEHDEMVQSRQDSIIASVVALALAALIFVSAYRETGRPLKAMACLIIGLGYTLGFATLAIGHLNILTVTFLPILIGLAIDFGVHLTTRYEEELREGVSESEALRKAMVRTGNGIITGCLTTAGAFLAMAVTDFRGIQEMGIITGAGMLLCLLPTLTMLPALLLRGKQNVLDHEFAATAAAIGRRAQLEKLWLRRPGLVTGITVVLSVLAGWQLRTVYFDYNLLEMQAKGLPAVVFEEKLIRSASKSVLFGAVVADSLAEARALETKLTNLPSVASVDSMAPFLGEEPSERLKRIREIKQQVRSIVFSDPDDGTVDIEELNQTLYFSQGYLGLAAGAASEGGEPQLVEMLSELRSAIAQLRHDLNANRRIQNARRLSAYQRALLEDVRQTFDTLRNQDSSSGLRVDDLPAPLRNRFIGKTGKFLLQVYPKGNVWERAEQETFIEELRRVDPNVTGTPVQLYEYTTLLKDSYERAAWYALGIIFILVFVHFRRFSCAVLALLPVGIGTLWMAGIMGASGVPFNPANIMTLPLVIGIGVTNGLHILNRFAEEQSPAVLAKSTGKAVLVSGLTTVAGFGSLIPAEHQGISSLGIVMSLGIITCMVAALAFLPALLNLLNKAGWAIRKPSADNAQAALGLEEPR